MTETAQDGIVVGRFQPLHIGHIEYLEAARSRCRRLFIGITNPDPNSRIATAADPHRSTSDANPFTYLQRHIMIEDALRGTGWNPEDFCVVPAPVLEPHRLVHYLPPPTCARFFLTIYDAWGEEKAEAMKDLGYSIEVLWRRNHDQRATSGTAIRSLIRQRQPWQHLVPPEIAHHVEMHVDRVRS